MNYNRFYKQLFRPIEKRIGTLDPATIMAIVGFDCGGPVSLNTVGRGRDKFVTYVTCELAVRKEQKPAKFGRYEAMMNCDEERWAHHVLTKIGQMSMERPFGHGHTIDISRVVKRGVRLQGLVVEEFARVRINRKGYCLLRFHGVTGSELRFAMANGTNTLLERLKRAGIYPNTSIRRTKSVAD